MRVGVGSSAVLALTSLWLFLEELPTFGSSFCYLYIFSSVQSALSNWFIPMDVKWVIALARCESVVKLVNDLLKE